MFHFARCINIIFNSLLTQLVKHDVHTTRKIKIHTRHYLSHIIIVLCDSLVTHGPYLSALEIGLKFL